MFTMPNDDFDLFDQEGNRKYLTQEERIRFYDSIDKALSKPQDREKRTFSLLLYYSGCRISEGLATSYKKIDYSAQGVVFETLKRRKKVHRFVPLPHSFLTKLDDVHRVKDYQAGRADGGKATNRIWSFGRTTGWKVTCKVMATAEIEGIQASPKGLRHSFAIKHQLLKTPETMTAQWLGHADTSMMAVYGRAVGLESREIASKLWA
jgi:integrase/recombinase XerD